LSKKGGIQTSEFFLQKTGLLEACFLQEFLLEGRRMGVGEK